jgi:hypothetical protein
VPTRTESLGDRHNLPEPAAPRSGYEESLRDLQVLVGIEGCHGGRSVSSADICELVEELVIV